ncbi:unnamed protein product [Urochloa decumbens]|uniref:[RNA-polymerase]-subunit kinase n=1 Tax=Urochloa decumbens TaxID=240449 RepID=A0ABC8ZLD4_9POAL
MGCVFGRAAASSSPVAPRRKRGKERASPQPAAVEAGSPSAAVVAGGDGRPRRRLGGRRAAGPKQGCVPAAAAAEQLAAGWPPWLVAVAGEALRGWTPRRADTFEKLNKIKCYMQQLLSGLEHCHDNNVLHRDIKGSNLLLDNNGILKIADFGLATFFDPRHKRPMTSRVVTLWYRPPELLLGATDYGVGIDLWSAGCILAELLYGKPIMPGRTEVEQLHKIFKLCGSPSEEYWKKSKLPHATIFKPQQPYKRCIRETFKDFPTSALPLVETLLAIDPAERQTATAALHSDFFSTEPYACDPSSLPTYPPSKEMDAKLRDEEARRLRAAAKAKGEAKRTRPRDRSHRAGPAPEANAEIQANLDQRRRMITHANAKSKSEKFPPPHQDGAMGNPLGSCRHMEPMFEHQDASFSTVVPIEKGTSQTWSGPLFDPSALGQSRRKKQTTLDAKAAAYSKQLQKEKGGIRAR